jgi:hypothetical protein
MPDRNATSREIEHLDRVTVERLMLPFDIFCAARSFLRRGYATHCPFYAVSLAGGSCDLYCSHQSVLLLMATCYDWLYSPGLTDGRAKEVRTRDFPYGEDSIIT